MATSIISIISDYLSLPEAEVILLAEKAPSTYKKYNIPKKKGGLRRIHHPSKQTKALQYALMNTFLSTFPVHSTAMAYVKDKPKPLFTNAFIHSQYPYTVKIDFKDFFPSICPESLEVIIRKNDKYKDISKADIDFVKKICFVKYQIGFDGLGIGAPSSPLISNIVMFELDNDITKIAREISNDSVYTRYADDIAFSTFIKGGCHNFLKKLMKLINITIYPKLAINDLKTIYCSRGVRRQITGLIITPNGEVVIGRKRKRYIRSLIHKFEHSSISEKDRKYLTGYLSFIMDIEPDFYNRLAIKYGDDILSKLKKS